MNLPIATRFSIGRVGDEEGIRTPSAILVGTKVECNFILHIQVILDILDLRKLERLRR
jgi:hypothetical protein